MVISKIGNNLGYVSTLSSIVYPDGTPIFNLRKSTTSLALTDDRWYASRPYAIGKGDDISIVLDNDVTSKRFDVTLSRRVSLTGSVYGNTGVVISDYFSTLFGPTVDNAFPLEDFALVMHPRVVTNPGTTSEVLWSWKDFGYNNIGIQYECPVAPSQTASWTLDPTRTATSTLSVTLPSGAARVLTNLSTSGKIAVSNEAETLNFIVHPFWLMLGYEIATLQSDGSLTTVTIASPSGVDGMTLTGCGLTNGATLYVTVDAGIPWLASGQYTISAVSGMTFKISAATGGAQGPTAGGTSHVALDAVAGADWTGVQLFDTLVLSSGFGAPAIVTGVPLIVEALGATTRWIKVVAKYGNVAAVTVPVLSGALTTTSFIQAFPSGGTIANIAAQVNALTTAPVSAIAVGAGGSIVDPTWYSQNNNTVSFPFEDGINYVKTTTMVSSGSGYNYTIDFKKDVSIVLAGYTQWAAEEAYLCPVTAASISAYLNQLAVCGLSANGSAMPSSSGSKVQIHTSTLGSVGSVQVRGGLANSAIADVHGAAYLTADLAATAVVVPTSQTSGFHAGWPARITNLTPYVKDYGITSGNLTSIVGNTWTFTAAIAYSHAEVSMSWQFEKHGKFWALVWDNDVLPPVLIDFRAGDYIVISNNGTTDTVSGGNLGTFVITAIDAANYIIYLENPNGVAERVKASINLIDRDSAMVGDKLVVGTTAWGASNKRTFTIASVPYVSDTAVYSFVTVETPAAVAVPVAGPQNSVQLRAGILHSFVKTINSVVPLAADQTYSTMTFVEDGDTFNYVAIGENYGSQISAMCKLAFPITTAIGMDGYGHSVGLIGEADKVMYGYETDPVSYPGVVAAGSNINISGPLVRRIQVGLSLRVRGTVSVVFEAVRGAVATFVNNSAVGESIAISDIIAVASSIGGVEAVSISSPTFSTSSDRIAVQPYEKALVLQPEQDITLTLIG
jgi:hypothetical protein